MMASRRVDGFVWSGLRRRGCHDDNHPTIRSGGTNSVVMEREKKERKKRRAGIATIWVRAQFALARKLVSYVGILKGE